jgi:hypothetical protein
MKPLLVPSELGGGGGGVVGILAEQSGITDIVDATVVEGALRRHDIVISSDPDDLEAISGAVHRQLEIDHP